jgi:hypothetical protein
MTTGRRDDREDSRGQAMLDVEQDRVQRTADAPINPSRIHG